MPKLRTKAQNSLMFGLASRAGVSHDDLREWTSEITNGRTDHTSELYFHEAVQIIDRLQAFVNPTADKTPRRTQQYRRQQAGVDQIVSPQQLQKLNDLWFSKPERTASGLESICFRTIKVNSPRTTKQCNAIIEAVKSMNRREAMLGGFRKNEKEVVTK